MYQYDKEVLGKAHELVETNPNSNQDSTHKVVKGDTLYSISKRYNTTIALIQDINNLEGTELQIGQILQLPKD